LQILIGNAYYNCSCVRYVTSEDEAHRWLIIPLCIAFGVLLIIIIIAIIIGIAITRRKRRCWRPREDVAAICDEGYPEYQPTECYATPVAEAANNANEPDDSKAYMSLGTPEPTNEASPYYSSPEKYYEP